MGRVIFFLCLGLSAAFNAEAEWTDISAGLGETDIRVVAVDMARSRVIYAASERRLYRWEGADSWKQLMGLKGSGGSIHDILSSSGGDLYVASDKGIQRSQDNGKKWKVFYRGIGDESKIVYCLLQGAALSKVLWAGSGAGLFRIDVPSGDAKRVEDIPRAIVRSIASDGGARMWASTDKGIYKTNDQGEHWRRVQVNRVSEAEEFEALSQFSIEELSLPMVPTGLVFLPGKDELYASTAEGVMRGLRGGETWTIAGAAVKVDDLTASDSTVYAASDKGAFRWDEKEGLKDISSGLPSKEVHKIIYDPATGDLIAATKQGVFRYPKPEFKVSVGLETPVPPDANDILRRFEYEPSIRQVQDAAIEYAEVHPDKIRMWREQASRKAWMPTVSLTATENDDQNIDLDRGGTNDPDRFIQGPNEKNRDWHAGLSWDLSEIIWNNDQTSIDTRSRLLVELRDDVLTEITHFYYERRRLQVEMIMTPAKDLPLEVERQLKLDELTANIDALTGGFFSGRVNTA